MSTTVHPPDTRSQPDEPLGELRFHRLLVAVDGSESARLALSAAVLAARLNNASLTVVSVAPEVSRWPAAAYDPGLQGEVDKQTQERLREAVDLIPADITVTTLFRRGSAGPQIVAAAAEGDYDAILLGARGVGMVASLVGSVSHHVLRHADTTVFVAHAPHAAGRG
jgi:nucleotide-binding universal stress UspA family protein